MKTEQIKPMLLNANKQIEAILKEYDFIKKSDFLHKAVIFDNSPPFEKSLNLLEIALPNIQKVGTTDFNNLLVLFEKVTELTNYQINNPVFATGFVLFQNFDENVNHHFKRNIAPFVICEKWEAGFPFNLFFCTDEIPDFTTNTFLKLFCRIDPKTLLNNETPEIEVITRKQPTPGNDKILNITPGDTQTYFKEFRNNYSPDEIFDLTQFAKYQFQQFCIGAHQKTKQLLTRQNQIKKLLQAEKAGKQNISRSHLKIRFKGTTTEKRQYLSKIHRVFVENEYFITDFENFEKACSDSDDFKPIDWLTPANDAICIFSGFENFWTESKDDPCGASFEGLLDSNDRNKKMQMLTDTFNFKKFKPQNQIIQLRKIKSERRPHNLKTLLAVIERLE